MGHPVDVLQLGPGKGSPDRSEISLTVPLPKIDGRRRVPGLDPHYARLDLWRRPKVVLAHLHEVVHPRQELRVDGQPAVELVAGLRHEPLRKLSLQIDSQ